MQVRESEIGLPAQLPALLGTLVLVSVVLVWRLRDPRFGDWGVQGVFSVSLASILGVLVGGEQGLGQSLGHFFRRSWKFFHFFTLWQRLSGMISCYETLEKRSGPIVQ